MNNAIPVGDFLYGFDGNVHMAGPKDFVCIRFSTGEVQWRSKDAGLMVGSLIVSGDRIIALGQRGELAIAPVDSEKFSPFAREQVIGGRCWTPPVLAHGMLYLRAGRPRLPRAQVKHGIGIILCTLFSGGCKPPPLASDAIV